MWRKIVIEVCCQDVSKSYQLQNKFFDVLKKCFKKYKNVIFYLPKILFRGLTIIFIFLNFFALQFDTQCFYLK